MELDSWVDPIASLDVPWSREKSVLMGIESRFPGCPNRSLVTVLAARSSVSMLVFIYNCLVLSE